MVGAGGDSRQVLGELFGDGFGDRLEEDGLDAVLVGAPPDVAALSVQRALQLRGGRRDVVREKELLLERHPHTLDVNPRRLVPPPPQDAAELRAFELLVTGEAQKVIPRRRHVRVRQPVQDEIGPATLRLRWRRDRRMKRLHVGEVALGGALQCDIRLGRPDLDLDAATIKRGQRVLQPDAELADHQVGLAAFFGILVLSQVLVVQPTTEVRDVPPVAPFDDLWFGRTAERVLVERVGDDLADRFGHAPVVEDLLDVQVEECRFLAGRQRPIARRARSSASSGARRLMS